MINSLKQYFMQRVELVGLKAQYYSTLLLAMAIQLLLMVILISLAVSVLSISAGLALGVWLQSLPLGFLFTGLFYVIFALIVYFCRERLRRYIEMQLDKSLTSIMQKTNENKSPHTETDQGPTGTE